MAVDQWTNERYLRSAAAVGAAHPETNYFQDIEMLFGKMMYNSKVKDYANKIHVTLHNPKG